MPNKMPIDDLTTPIFESLSVAFATKAFLILFLVFYVIFALILYRQIQLMCKTLITPVGPFLQFVGIVHVGAALALLLITLGVF